MLKKYDLIIEHGFPDDCAILYPDENGLWVSADDAEERIRHLVSALQSLKSCDISINSPEVLNLFVDRTLAGYL